MQVPHTKSGSQAITFDVTAPSGYEIKHAALHGAGRYDDAVKAFETMLSKMGESPDPQIRGQQHARFYKDDSLT